MKRSASIIKRLLFVYSVIQALVGLYYLFGGTIRAMLNLIPGVSAKAFEGLTFPEENIPAPNVLSLLAGFNALNDKEKYEFLAVVTDWDDEEDEEDESISDEEFKQSELEFKLLQEEEINLVAVYRAATEEEQGKMAKQLMDIRQRILAHPECF